MMITASPRCRSAVFPLLLALCWLGLSPGDLAAATQSISGSPLEVTVSDYMDVTVMRYEAVQGSSPVTYEYDRQYFSSYSPFLVLTPPGVGAPGTPTAYSGIESTFTPVSNTTMPDGSIVTVVTAANGDITIQQTVSYVNGAQQYQHSWVVTNTSTGATYTGVALRYGGDTYFANSDEASGFWDASQNFVYCTNPNVSGLMGILGSPQTPATNYYEDGYSLVWTALENPSAPLPNTVQPSFIDNGMGLEWVEGTLAPQASFNVTAIEKWTAAGAVQVIAPQPITATVGSQLSVSFTVQNLESSGDTFALAATGSTGLSASAPATVQIAANSSVNVTVTVNVTALTGSPEVTLTATSETTSTIANQDSVAISAPPGTVQVSPPSTAQYIGVGASVTVPFVVTNGESTADSFSFTTASSTGLVTGTIAPVTIAAGASATVSVPVTCQSLLSLQASESVSLTATAHSNSSITATSAFMFTISPIRLALSTTPAPVTIGQECAAAFTLTNGETVSDTFSFYASAPIGLQTTGIANVTVGSNGTQVVNLPIDILSYAGTTGTVTVTAFSTTTTGITAQTSVTLTPAPVIVIAPSVQTAVGTATLQLTFIVANTTANAMTYNLSVNSITGLSLGVPATVQISGNSTANVQVSVTVLTPLAAGSADLVTLIASEQSSPTTTARATAVVVPPRAVVQPGIPLSNGPATVFNSICPCTPEGASNLLAVMAGQTDLTAAAYAWDATSQVYVTLPTQPTGGLVPSSGVFIATRLNLPLDFSGTPTEVPATKILLPGWNFVGLPALDESGTAVVNASWPSDFALYDQNGALVDPSVNTSTYINDLGTVGSSDVTTTEPYLYNGSAYVQVETLQTGTGYWIKNNNVSSSLALVRLAPNLVTLARSSPSAAATARTTSGTTTVTTGSAAAYIDRGAPPEPPTSSSASPGGGSNGCGLGAGAASVLGFGLMLMRRRLRG